MSSTGALRRGKVLNKAGNGLQVESGPESGGVKTNVNSGGLSALELQQQRLLNEVTSSHPTASIAVVRRNYCGTGPFDRHWLNLDCCGLFCALITYGLHLYGVFAVCRVLLPPWMSYMDEENVRYSSIWGHIHSMLFTGIALMACASHFKAMTTDPGAVPPDAKPLPEPLEDENGEQQPRTMRLCRRCKSYKPERAHHCSVCRRCIIKMDHHCPWVNNCVGIGNHKYFLLFVFYTFLSCIYSLALVIARFATCVGYHRGSRNVGCLDRPAQLLYILGLLIEALLFGMFTSCMMFDQFEVIHSKLTHIDRLKGTDITGTLAGITEVFGSASPSQRKRYTDDTRFRPDWLSPFARVCFPESLKDEVMGFCQPCVNAIADAASVASGAVGDAASASVNTARSAASSGLRNLAEIV